MKNRQVNSLLFSFQKAFVPILVKQTNLSLIIVCIYGLADYLLRFISHSFFKLFLYMSLRSSCDPIMVLHEG